MAYIIGSTSGGSGTVTSVGAGTNISITGTPTVNPTVNLIASPTVTSITISNAPSVGTDGTNKTYVDSAIASVNPSTSVFSASTTNIPGTYTPVGSGIGDTFLTTATGAFTLDGTSPSVGARILLKDQSTTFQNGVYTLTTNGTGITGTLFTRAVDYNQPSDINSTGVIAVLNGTVNALTGWLINVTVVTVGTSPITYTKYNNAPITTTQFDVLVGGASNTVVSVGPGTTGQVFQSAGNASNPAYSTSTYPLTNALGDIVYGTSANVLGKLVLPTTIGSRLIYDGTNLYWYDPLKDLYMEDDFFGMLSSGNPTSATGWEANNNGTGATATIQNNPTIADATHPGTVTLTTGTVATNYSGLIASQNNNQGGILLGGGELNQYWIINVPVLSNGTDRFSVLAGLMMFNSTPTINSGVWFGYIDNVNGGAFTINTANNGSVTTTNSTAAAVIANTWYKLHINVNAAGTLVTFFVNGVSVGTVSTNIPVTTGNNNFFVSPASYIVKSVGTNALTLVLDKHILLQKMTSAR